MITRRLKVFLVNLLSFSLLFVLPLFSYLLFHNLMRLEPQIDYEPTLSVYLSPTATANQRTDAGILIRRLPAVQDTTIIKRETVLARMKADIGMKEALSLLSDNPFPDTIIVHARSSRVAALNALKTELEKIKFVDQVEIDSDWAKRLDSAVDLGRVMAVIIVVLLLAPLFAMAIALGRLEVLRDAEEIRLLCLLGGAPSVIRRPYAYYGLVLGTASALLGIPMVFGCFQILLPDVAALSKAYDSDFVPTFIPVLPLVCFVLISGILGAFGGWVSARRFSFD